MNTRQMKQFLKEWDAAEVQKIRVAKQEGRIADDALPLANKILEAGHMGV